MKWLFTIASPEPETIYNALRLANLAAQKENQVSVFMLGAAVEFQDFSTEHFDLAGLAAAFQERGDFYV